MKDNFAYYLRGKNELLLIPTYEEVDAFVTARVFNIMRMLVNSANV